MAFASLSENSPGTALGGRRITASGGPVRWPRLHSGALLIALDGVDSREAALGMKGAQVGISRSALPAAAEGEYYWDSLTGFSVRNRAGALLGEVSGLTEHGAHPLLRVARPAGESGAERLIPFVPAIVEGVDIDAARIDVDWGEDF